MIASDCFVLTLQLIHDVFHTRYRTPAAYSTGNRILIALRNVIVRRLCAMLDNLRKERGQPFLSGQLDLWSSGLGKCGLSEARRHETPLTPLGLSAPHSERRLWRSYCVGAHRGDGRGGHRHDEALGGGAQGLHAPANQADHPYVETGLEIHPVGLLFISIQIAQCGEHRG